ncbi:MAG: phenylalanine--tRNA ligase subunit beta [Pseudanabaenaceae cyanobacterium]
MKVSCQWLKQLVEFDLTPTELADKLTMAGFEVEDIEDRSQWAQGVVLGKILTAERHPNADKLQVCTVDVGKGKPLQIVCGAANAKVGLLVPVALVGTYLPKIDVKIRAANLRGVRSEGMICSLAELGLEKESAGIHEFNLTEYQLGMDVRPLLGLDDAILEITSTANRADALSMVGIAREVAALCQGKLTLPLPQKKCQPPVGDWVEIKANQSCPAYIGTIIKGVKVGKSPAWLQSRLEKAGFRTINNIVDVTNYILLEWGQPLHAFDLDRLGGNPHIAVEFAQAGQQLLTLDGVTRELTGQNLLITADGVPVAIAGVMGGADTEVSDTTQSILLEAALFTSPVVRRSARAQGLRTESSARYERGVNPANLEIACDRAIELILEIAGGEVVERSMVDHRAPCDREIILRLARVWQVLGVVERGEGVVGFLQPEEVETALRSLGFELVRTNLEVNSVEEIDWLVMVPDYRYNDIEREIDLIEEIARIYGYEKFTETLPARTELGYLPPDQHYLRQIRSMLKGLGLTEVMHYSLINPEVEESYIRVTNPIATEYSGLRSDLMNGLLNACVYNFNQGNGILNAFEIGRVFLTDEEGMLELEHLGMIFGGNPSRYDWMHRTQPLNWYEAKGILDTFFAGLGLAVEYQPDQKDTRLHPGRTASLWLHGERLGTFGEIHPRLKQKLELPERIYLAELELDILLEGMAEQALPVFKPFSTFPAIDRDLAFFSPICYSVAEITRAIYRAGGELLESVALFDEYRGEGVPEGQRSLAFRLVYRASDRTLTDADIQPIQQQIRDTLAEKFQAVLRS